jgi:hypothetical protein
MKLTNAQRAGLSALLLFALPAHAAWPPPVPAEITLELRNTAATARVDELAIGGVPLPRALNLRTLQGLAMVDAQGSAVAAGFRVLARWHAARDETSAPIQWLQVRLLADVPANGSARYRLLTDGSVANPAPAQPLTLSQIGAQWQIDTGVARFVLGASPARLFDRIEVPVGNLLVDASSLSANVDGLSSSGFTSIRSISVEHADSLGATLRVEGTFAHPLVGGGLISGGRRLQFAAGSSAVSVREWIDWEGDRCGLGTLSCEGTPNARELQRWRIALSPTLSGPRTLTVLAQPGQPAVATAAVGSVAELRQLRRAQRLQPQQYTLTLPGQPAQPGARADAGALLLSGNQGRVGIALAQMADFEPQALRLLADGSIAADLADDGVWLGARQGTYAEYRLGAWPLATGTDAALGELRRGLDHPLWVIAAPEWIAASQATEEFPVGTLAPALASYDNLLDDLIARTQTLRRERGLEGLQTFGLFPREWGNPIGADEIDCGDDPTPTQDWDDPYWCASWTDYHNTSMSAWVHTWRHSDPAALRSLAIPAALRMLHTQLQRCAPDDDFFHCGQVPTGYGGYRANNNGSHQYIEGLAQYYWLSGDDSVVERLAQGARVRRAYMCPARGSTPPGPMCGATTPIADPWAGLNDRVAVQAYHMFRLVGLTADASFLTDWSGNTARALTQNFALLQSGGQTLGFTEPSGSGDFSIIGAAGSYYTTQTWMASVYDFNQLQRLRIDSQDAALGSPAINPSIAIDAWARTLMASANIAPGGNGGASGVWPNELRFTFSGNRVGGALTQLQPGWAPGPAPQPCEDRCLYDSGKASLSATLARSADAPGDNAMRQMALDLSMLTLQVVGQLPQPMNKATGLYFGRLHAAVARLSQGSADPLFGSGFE